MHTSHKKMDYWLSRFVTESLCIEDIFREPTEEELKATRDFIQLDNIEIVDLVQYVKVFQPDARLRESALDRVWIAGREAPRGGMDLIGKLGNLLWSINQKTANEWNSDPHKVHAEYEYLHPFTDGNGRSGRAIWANLMWYQGYDFRYLFLQMFYYQTLSKYNLNK